MNAASGVPDYADLPQIEALQIKTSWGLLPPSLGTLAFLSDDARTAAAHAVRTGETVSLNLSTAEFDPPLFGRPAIDHRVVETARNVFEDDLADFNPQSTSQWDGFLHIRMREFGYYGGVTDAAEARDTVGIQHFAAAGIVGRGVLVDVARSRAGSGVAWDPQSGDVIEAAELADILLRQGVQLEPGDILCIRTGWLSSYRGLVAAGADLSSAGDRFSGISANDAMVGWLWDHRVAAVASDNPAIESAPGDVRNGSLHRKLLAGLGMPFAELLDLERVADRAAASGVYTFLFASAPMALAGGASSTANALAIL